MIQFWRTASVAKKLFLGFVPALALFGAFVFYGIQFLESVSPALDGSARVLREFSAFSYVKTISSATSALVGTYALSGREELERRYDEFAKRRDEALIAAEAAVINKEAQEVLRQFSVRLKELRGVELLIVAETKAGNRDAAAALLENRYVEEETEALERLDVFTEQERGQVEMLNQGLLDRSRRIVELGTFALIPLVVLVAIFFYLILLRSVLRPVRNLTETTERIKNGEITARATAFFPDDMGVLATAFNKMADSVLLSEKALRVELRERTKQVETIDRLLKEQAEHLRLLKAHEAELGTANEQLRKLDALKSEFLTVAAHRLRTPLTSIHWTYEELLKSPRRSLTDDQRKILEDGFQSSVLAIKLINQLLDLARMEEGRSAYVKERQSIVPIIVSAVEQFKKTAAYKNVTLSAMLPKDPVPNLDIDHEKIATVVETVLDNAVKYTPPKGTISVSLSAQTGSAVLRVSDTGIGVPKDEQSNLFTKFFRADNALLFHTEGTGLGLYVAKRIVEDHNGTISIESEGGKGTTVTITLPTVL